MVRRYRDVCIQKEQHFEFISSLGNVEILWSALFTGTRRNHIFNSKFSHFREENNVSSANAVPQRVVSIQFVDEGDVTEVFEDHREVQIDEYETDSDDEESDFEEHSELVNRACAYDTRSGRAVRALVRLDM